MINSTHAHTTLTVKVAHTEDQAVALVAEGFCPVECSFGGSSVVDELKMDHHGELSHLEAVSSRAYREHFGVRKDDPRFVIAGAMDADAAFAIAALAGLLPHPEKDVTGVPPHLVKGMTTDWADLAETVAIIDTDPVGRDLTSLPKAEYLGTWSCMFGGGRDDLSAAAGVSGWIRLLGGNFMQLKPFLAAAHESEKNRRDAALADLEERGEKEGAVLAFNGSRVFGFDVWYGRNPEHTPDELAGWANPVVVALVDRSANITMGCPNDAIAEKLFGDGGLKNVFAHLEGWGGREAVGGSPRGQKMTAEDLKKVVDLVNKLAKR